MGFCLKSCAVTQDPSSTDTWVPCPGHRSEIWQHPEGLLSLNLCSLQLSTQGTSGLRAPASSTEGQNARLSTHWPHGEVIVPNAFSQGPPWKCAWYLLISHSPTFSFISVPSTITLRSLEVLLWACVPFLPGSFTLISLLSRFIPELINPRCSPGYKQGSFS